jgi:hypothetical protein
MPTPYQNVILAESNLKAFWPLNETSGTTINDISGNGFNGTITPSTTLRLNAQGVINDGSPGIVGNAASNAGYVSLPTLGITSGSFSIEFWINPVGAGGTATNYGIIYSLNTGGNDGFYWHNVTDNNMHIETSGADFFTANTSLTVGKRWHFVFVWDGTLERAYCNGAPDGTHTPGTAPTWNGPGHLFIMDTSTNQQVFKGTIQNVAAYTKILTPTSVKQHYVAGMGRAVASSRVYTGFSPTNGTLFFNRSASSYITLPTTGLPTGAQPWTIEGWGRYVVVPSSGSNFFMGGFGTYSNKQMAMFGVQGFNTEAQAIYSGYSQDAGAGTAVPQVNTWLYLAVTYDGVTALVYVNGVQLGSTSYTANIVLTFANIGSGNNGSDLFYGYLKNFAFYTTKLSAARITAHYTASAATYNATVLADSPWGFWALNETSGSVAHDLTANGHNGTIGAGVTLAVPNTFVPRTRVF